MNKLEQFYLAITFIGLILVWVRMELITESQNKKIDELRERLRHYERNISGDISTLSFKIRELEIRQTPGNEVIKTDRLIMEEFKEVKWTQHGIGLKPGYYIVAIPDYPAILSDDKDKFCFIISSFYDGKKFDHPEVTHFLIGLKPPKEYSEKNFIEKYKESMKVK